MVPKRVFPVFIGVLMLGWLASAGFSMLRDTQNAKAEAALLKAALDSTEVTLTSAKIDKKKYEDLLTVVRKLDGKPVAGARIIVTRWDTVFIHDTLYTTVYADGTRTATFTDSTTRAVVRADITAPPCCAPLQAKLQVTIPEQVGTIGFVQVGTKTVAVAKWGDQEVRVDAPFYRPVKAPRLTSFVEALGDAETLTLRGGTSLRVIGGWSAVAALDQRFKPGEQPRIGAGVRYTF